jgi:hypothetical protein
MYRQKFEGEPSKKGNEINQMALASELSWLPIVDAFRTFAACPLPEGRTFRSPSWATIELS